VTPSVLGDTNRNDATDFIGFVMLLSSISVSVCFCVAINDVVESTKFKTLSPVSPSTSPGTLTSSLTLSGV